MAHWNGEKIVYMEAKQDDKYPGWDVIDCGCCVGIMWGGEIPLECPHCDGFGVVYQHRESGIRALYPGGPFC